MKAGSKYYCQNGWSKSKLLICSNTSNHMQVYFDTFAGSFGLKTLHVGNCYFIMFNY